MHSNAIYTAEETV